MTYITRIADTELARLLASAGAVVIEGPKACGKTETARQRSASEILLDVDDAARRALLVAPTVVLNDAAPQLVDEWQLEAKAVWNNIRRLVDDRKMPGQFILTGSATPDDDADRHTGAGRFATLLMRPMSLYEIGRSNGAISLGDLLAGITPSSPEPGLTVADLTEIAAVGGWPANQRLSVTASLQANRSYLDQICNVDVERLTGEHRDPSKLRRLVMSLARNIATEVNVKTLAADAGGEEGPLSRTTVYDYLAVLERLMIIENQP
ncbi:MAG: ATP-binding protein, partial [Microthrixaceae bacterium]|nr:ATP-binding protein [Microthrixaceae bacterium]